MLCRARSVYTQASKHVLDHVDCCCSLLVYIQARKHVLNSCELLLLPPGNTSQIVHITRLSVLNDIHHEVGIDDLAEVLQVPSEGHMPYPFRRACPLQ